MISTDDRPILEAVLEACDSIMTYRSRYLLRIEPAAAIDLLVTDTINPRSIMFQLERIMEVMDELPTEADEVALPVERRTVLDLLHKVRLAQPELLIQQNPSGKREALDALLAMLTDVLPNLSEQITARYLIHTTPSQSLTGVTLIP